MKSPPEIHFGVLGLLDLDWNPLGKELIYLKGESPSKAYSSETGIKSKFKGPKPEGKVIQESIRQPRRKIYMKFLKNRGQLSKDIQNYVHEKHPGLNYETEKKGLEKLATTASALFLFSGIIASGFNLTGNTIGTLNNLEPLGFVLIILGILGLLLSRKI